MIKQYVMWTYNDNHWIYQISKIEYINDKYYIYSKDDLGRKFTYVIDNKYEIYRQITLLTLNDNS